MARPRRQFTLAASALQCLYDPREPANRTAALVLVADGTTRLYTPESAISTLIERLYAQNLEPSAIRAVLTHLLEARPCEIIASASHLHHATEIYLAHPELNSVADGALFAVAIALHAPVVTTSQKVKQWADAQPDLMGTVRLLQDVAADTG